MRKLLRRLLFAVVAIIGIAATGFIILGLIPVSADPVLPSEAIIVGAQNGAGTANLSLDFPQIVTPVDNPITPKKQELGRLLFFDPVLSARHDMSCATCHHPDLGFSDGKPTGIGSDGKPLTRNVPTLYEVAYKSSLFWDGRARRLEEQLKLPMTAANEMAGNPEKIVADLKAIPEYQALFAHAFPNQADPVTFDNVVYALATFERTLIAHNSPFDRFARGDLSALTSSQRRGQALFRSGATRCYNCHLPPVFSSEKFNVTGVPGAGGKLEDLGRGAITGNEADKYAFAAPTLRNISLTAPYMHNGTFATLEEVIAFYAKGGGKGLNLEVSNQARSVRPFELNDQEKQDLINFLYSLTDEGTKPAIPDKVPSGLPVVRPLDNPARAIAQARNAGGSAATPRPPSTLTITPDVTIQSVVDQAISGDVIEIQYGTYYERVVIDQDTITLRGVPNAKGEWPILDGQMKFTDGIVVSGDHFTVEKLAVKNYQGNGIIVDGATGVVFRDLYVENMGLYGVYPVHSTNILIERVKATNIRDAGLYAGQSRDIIIRDNEVYGNVVGIEVENSINAEVYNNHAHDNTAGISVHLLPQLSSKVSQKTKIYNNLIENNNLQNAAKPDQIVAMVPAGTGLLIMGSDDVEVYGNTLRNNQTGGIGVLSTAAFLPTEQIDVGPTPERVHVHDNTFERNGYQPDKLLSKLGVSGADIIWDGSHWDNTFDERGITSFPPVLPSSRWPILVRRSYWQLVHFIADKLF